ncbi:DUF742 domain-containing protein, partial [Micrococcus luteus]
QARSVETFQAFGFASEIIDEAFDLTSMVLLSDLADQGKIRVYGTGHGPGQPDRALLERVLNGLRRL